MAEKKPKAHVSAEKKKVVAEFVKLINEYPIVAAVNVESIPAKQLAKMRSLLRGKVVILMTKRRLIKLAIKSVKDKKPGIEALEAYLVGMPALLFTKDNPFRLFKILEKNKSRASAKAGQIAPDDISVESGPTPFAPGPIIGELGQIGLKAGIESGKVVIKQGKIVVKKGEKISAQVASILTRLDIHPMQIGLDLTAAYEAGVIFTKDVLAVDETAFLNKIKTASSEAVNLSVFTAYPTQDTITLIVQKSYKDAKGLAVSQSIYADGIMGAILAKAEREMLGVKARMGA